MAKPTQKYVRNLHGTPVGIRLDTGKRLDLKRRGERGDLLVLTKEEAEDAKLEANVELGLVELISAAEAKTVVSKQTTNIQQRVHPAMAALHNQLGQAYEGDVKIEKSFEEQGTVVAKLDGHSVYDKRTGIRRADHQPPIEGDANSAHGLGLGVSIDEPQKS